MIGSSRTGTFTSQAAQDRAGQQLAWATTLSFVELCLPVRFDPSFCRRSCAYPSIHTSTVHRNQHASPQAEQTSSKQGCAYARGTCRRYPQSMAKRGTPITIALEKSGWRLARLVCLFLLIERFVKRAENKGAFPAKFDQLYRSRRMVNSEPCE